MGRPFSLAYNDYALPRLCWWQPHLRVLYKIPQNLAILPSPPQAGQFVHTLIIIPSNLRAETMERDIGVIVSLDNYNPQVLAPEALEEALVSLKKQLLKTEAAKLLLPSKEYPFGRIALTRLSSLLNLVFRDAKQHEPKIKALRELDSVSMIICGLCLTQKLLDSMRKDLFDAFLEQATIASQACVQTIASSDEINKVVLNSVTDDDFLQRTLHEREVIQWRVANETSEHFKLRRLANGPAWPSLQYSLAGNPSWCYSKVPQPGSSQTIFSRLLNKALRGYTTTFLPSEASTDGLVRVMMPFEQQLLQTLFGWKGGEAIDAGK